MHNFTYKLILTNLNSLRIGSGTGNGNLFFIKNFHEFEDFYVCTKE